MGNGANIELKGIAWGHTRGLVPMVATAQRFAETHPGVEIRWEKRTLQEFADYPVEELADRFDLLVIDHPFVGHAARKGVFVPLDEYLPTEFLADQARNSVGLSHSSYSYDGHQWALAIDAAAPVACWRPDLLARRGIGVPRSWDHLLALARERWVAFPANPVDCVMNFFMFCCSGGEDPFSHADRVVRRDVGARALLQMRELASLCTPEIFEWNPIQTCEALAQRGDLVYCPFAFGYSNYARTGYAKNLLQFGDVIEMGGVGRARTTLGGTGLAISTRCRHRELVAEYAQVVAGPECQRTLYVQSGGQPGHRSAWVDEEANRITNNFFRDTLPAMERAYLRPRYDGIVEFQERAGPVVQGFLIRGGDPVAVVDCLQRAYEQSRPAA